METWIVKEVIIPLAGIIAFALIGLIGFLIFFWLHDKYLKSIKSRKKANLNKAT